MNFEKEFYVVEYRESGETFFEIFKIPGSTPLKQLEMAIRYCERKKIETDKPSRVLLSDYKTPVPQEHIDFALKEYEINIEAYRNMIKRIKKN